MHLETDQTGRLSNIDFLNAEDERFHRIPQLLKLNDDNDSAIIEGDILSDQEDTDYISEIISNADKKWPKIGEYVYVPFTFPSTASEQAKADIARVVLEFRNNTCIWYVLGINLAP